MTFCNKTFSACKLWKLTLTQIWCVGHLSHFGHAHPFILLATYWFFLWEISSPLLHFVGGGWHRCVVIRGLAPPYGSQWELFIKAQSGVLIFWEECEWWAAWHEARRGLGKDSFAPRVVPCPDHYYAWCSIWFLPRFPAFITNLRSQ